LTARELLDRFPEIPPDLLGEPALEQFAAVFDGLLRRARNPHACSAQYDAGNHYYLKLVGPLAIYGFGLATRERVLADVQALLDRHAADPQGFVAGLVPAGTGSREVRGPSCS
jgi:hypothetical protein